MCERCQNDFSEDLYKYNGEWYCWHCLEYELCEKDIIQMDSITHYFLGGEHIGDDNDIESVIDLIVENEEIEVKERRKR